jgi:hypothetical protein
MAGPVEPPVPEQVAPASPEERVEKPIARPLRVLRPQRTYTHRFRAAYVALALVFWGTVAGGTLIVVRGSSDDGPPWSTWKPTASGLDAASQIAAHVGVGYRQDDGTQLVNVRVHRPQVYAGSVSQNLPIAAVAVQSSNTILPADDSLVYELFGAGAGGSIASGQASPERLRLLRREALELALYTFKYVKGVGSVITLLPPPAKTPSTNWSVFFRKTELQRQLDHSLRATLPDGEKLTPSTITPVESSTIEELTRPRWFNFQYVQARDGNVVLLLKPLTASG